MAIVIAGSVSGNAAEVDSDKHIMIAVRPPAFGNNGCYTKTLVSGTIAASASAGAVHFSLRNTSASILTLIERIRLYGITVAAAGTQVGILMGLYFARSFTTDYTTNIGTSGTFTGKNATRRTSHAAATLASMLINGTAAAGLTGATNTPDTDAIAVLQGSLAATTGQNIFPVGATLWDMDNGNSHPIILAQNEGLIIKNPVAGPATATYSLVVAVDWQEVSSY